MAEPGEIASHQLGIFAYTPLRLPPPLSDMCPT